MRALQSELLALEIELADPSNPLLQNGQEDDAIDPGELIRGLVDVRGRLEKIRKDKQGRGKLVGVVLGERGDRGIDESLHDKLKRVGDSTLTKVDDKAGKSEARGIIEMDRRVGELEKLLGSSSVTLDEVLQPCFPSSEPLTLLKHSRFPHCHHPYSLSSPGSTPNSPFLHNPVILIPSLDVSNSYSLTLIVHLPKTTHTDAILLNPPRLDSFHNHRTSCFLCSRAWNLRSRIFLTF